MSAALIPLPMWQLFDGQATLPGAKVYAYQPGTTTPKALYADASGTTALSNPAIADADGRLQVWGIGAYKLVVHDAADALVWSMDQVSSAGAGSGGLPASTYATFADAVTAAQAAGRGLLIDAAMTISTNTTVPAAVPLTFTPPGVLTVASGVTLTLTTDPGAGRWKIFTANGSTTGLVRFAVGACAQILPEWWGIDPTGVVDGTALWAQVLAAAADRAPIAVTGIYRIESTSPNAALVLPDGVQLVGPVARGNAAEKPSFDGQFWHYGTGTGVQIASTGSSRLTIRLENLLIYDPEGTGAVGLQADRAVGLTMRHVWFVDWDIGMKTTSYLYYGSIERVMARQFRTSGFDMDGGCNEQLIDIGAVSSVASVTVGVKFGAVNRSHKCHLRISSELTTGIPVEVSNLYGSETSIYTEGGSGHHAIQLNHVFGGTLTLYLLATADFTTGLYILPGAEGSGVYPSGRLRVEGYIDQASLPGSPYLISTAGETENYWGIDLSGLHLGGVNPPSGVPDFVTGCLIGTQYHTMGSTIPLANQGRGSTTNSLNWQVGDTVRNTSQARGEVLGWVCTVAGNPGTWVPLGASNGTVDVTADTDLAAFLQMAHVSNRGASGVVTCTLPDVHGMPRQLRFTCVESSALQIDPAGSDNIVGGGAGKYLSLPNLASVLLENINGAWIILASVGSLSYEP